MEKLPKVLVTSLAGICEEKELISWNISSNGHAVSVNIRFMEKGHASNMHGSQYHDTPRTGMRATKSPGQLRRDYFRANSFKRNTIPKLDVSCETEESQSFCNNERQVCETPLQEPLHINSQYIDSPDKTQDPGHVRPSNQQSENKTKAHGQETVTPNNIQDQQHSSGNGDDQMLSDHANDLMLNEHVNDQILSDHATDQMLSDHGNECSLPGHFSKITADFRAMTEFTTLRAITQTGEIVCYEPRNRRNQFYVLYEYDMFDNYNPSYGRALEAVERFDDITSVEYWKNDIEQLRRKYDEFCKEMYDGTE